MANKKQQYELTRPIYGSKTLQPGTIVDLTPEEAESLFYRSRVRKLHSEAAELVPAVAPQGTNTDVGAQGDTSEGTDQQDEDNTDFDWEDYREGVIAELEGQGLDYDPESPAEELAALLDEQVREAVVLAAQ